jgi:hypothetical protein
LTAVEDFYSLTAVLFFRVIPLRISGILHLIYCIKVYNGREKIIKSDADAIPWPWRRFGLPAKPFTPGVALAN